MTKQRTYLSYIVFCPQYFEDYKLIDRITGNRTEHAENFLPYVGFASQIPNLLLNWINIILPLGAG
jgi:equilibrative nucleoside transporter 1/2/3